VDEASRRAWTFALVALFVVIVGIAGNVGLVAWAMYQFHFE